MSVSLASKMPILFCSVNALLFIDISQRNDHFTKDNDIFISGHHFSWCKVGPVNPGNDNYNIGNNRAMDNWTMNPGTTRA